jgi:hypothetical protein
MNREAPAFDGGRPRFDVFAAPFIVLGPTSNGARLHANRAGSNMTMTKCCQ